MVNVQTDANDLYSRFGVPQCMVIREVASGAYEQSWLTSCRKLS